MSVEDYYKLPGDHIKAIDDWLTEKDLTHLPVTAIRKCDDGAIEVEALMGYDTTEDWGSLLSDVMIIRHYKVDDFPWEHIDWDIET